jgi:uncharacterized protein with von Willebrand factor type A (vWA) domain
MIVKINYSVKNCEHGNIWSKERERGREREKLFEIINKCEKVINEQNKILLIIYL